MKRLVYRIEDIIKEIPGSIEGAGEDLSLSAVYDDIKGARFEEDERLSVGIWERELKRADWEKVEAVAIDALQTKTKDLQIVGWLMEAIVSINGIDGLVSSIEILRVFVESFWTSSFPKNEKGESDDEHKFQILEWIYNTINKRFHIVPIIEYQNNKISIYNYEYAHEVQTKAKKSPQIANEIFNSAKKNEVLLLDDIQSIIRLCKKDYIESVKRGIDRVEDSIDSVAMTISKVSDDEKGQVFKGLKQSIDIAKKMLAIWKDDVAEASKDQTVRQEPRLFGGSPSGMSRDEIYKKIENLAKDLEVLEKHSPSHYLLNLVVSWKNKGLFEIMTDVKSGDSEAHKLLKILINH